MKIIKVLLLTLTLIFADSIAPVDQVLPWEKSLVKGMLENGFKYTILKSSIPKERAELALYVGVGSLDEKEDQRGIAHLIEHMAFNGTEHFKRNELVTYLESIGMKFGGDLNANTQFSQTTYTLSLPLRGEHLEKCLTIASDWAGGLNFNENEFNKERGVVLEERRLRNSVGYRLLIDSLPMLYTNPRYAKRVPIGLVDVIKHISVKRAKEFYTTWYRPEFMHLVVVGDFNATSVEKMVKERFSSLKNRSSEKRVSRDMPQKDSTTVVTLTDKELTSNTIQIVYGKSIPKLQTINAKREAMVNNIAMKLFYQKAQEQILKKSPKTLKIESFSNLVSVNRENINFIALYKSGDIDGALKELYSLMWSFKKYGFAKTNFNLVKEQILSDALKMHKTARIMRSEIVMNKLLNSISTDSIYVDYDYDLNLTKTLLKDISLKEVNNFFSKLIDSKNRVILFKTMTNDGLDKNSTLQILESAKLTAKDLSKVEALPKSILDVNLTAKPIVSKSYNKELDIHRYKLSNGIIVDFKRSIRQKNILFLQASSQGGNSILPIDELHAMSYAPEWVSLSGVGKFTNTQIAKIYSNKQLSVDLSVNRFNEEIKATCSSFDAKSMFELLYVKLMQAKLDEQIFKNGKRFATTTIMQIEKNPSYHLIQEVIEKYFKNDPRLKMTTVEDVADFNKTKMLELYKKRFSDMNNFYFTIVGDMKPKEVENLISIYLANLSTQDRDESYSSKDYDRLKGKQSIKSYHNSENRAELSLEYHAIIPFSLENQLLLGSVVNILNVRLRNVLREDKSGTYNIDVKQDMPFELKDKATITISFKSDPKRVDELIDSAKGVIESFIKNGATIQEIANFKESTKVELKNLLTYDTFWTNTMIYANEMNISISKMIDVPSRFDILTKENISKISKTIFTKDMLQSELLPIKEN